VRFWAVTTTSSTELASAVAAQAWPAAKRLAAAQPAISVDLDALTISSPKVFSGARGAHLEIGGFQDMAVLSTSRPGDPGSLGTAAKSFGGPTKPGVAIAAASA
jgi:hypothetical protein